MCLRGQKFEVAFARNTSGSQVVLDDEHRNRSVFWNHHGPYHAWPRENHVITFGADATESFGFEYLDELFIGDWIKLWHASAAAGESHAAH